MKNRLLRLFAWAIALMMALIGLPKVILWTMVSLRYHHYTSATLVVEETRRSSSQRSLRTIWIVEGRIGSSREQLCVRVADQKERFRIAEDVPVFFNDSASSMIVGGRNLRVLSRVDYHNARGNLLTDALIFYLPVILVGTIDYARLRRQRRLPLPSAKIRGNYVASNISCTKVATAKFRYEFSDMQEPLEFYVKEFLGCKNERLYEIDTAGGAWVVELKYLGKPSSLAKHLGSVPLVGAIKRADKELATISVYLSEIPSQIIIQYKGGSFVIRPAHPRNSGGDIFIEKNDELMCTIYGEGKRGFQRPVGNINRECIPDENSTESSASRITVISAIVLADLFAIPILNASV